MNDIVNDGVMQGVRKAPGLVKRGRKSKTSNKHNHLRQLLTTEIKLKQKRIGLLRDLANVNGALREVRKQLRDF